MLRQIERNIVRRGGFSGFDKILSMNVSPQDSILINGFWRSGTTFLMELIENIAKARSFFEPLHSEVAPAKPFQSDYLFNIGHTARTQTYPYIKPDGQASEEFDSFLLKMIKGQISTPWTRNMRKLKNSCYKRVVVKMVRGNLLSAYIQNKFKCYNFFILRHPCAVVSSIIREKSGLPLIRGIRKSLESEKFINIFLDQSKLVDDYLTDYIDCINNWNKSPIGRIVLSYAIANYIPLRQIEENIYNPNFILYEELTLNPTATITEICKYLNIDDVGNSDNSDLLFDSQTTKTERHNVDPVARCFSWKNDLKKNEIETVYKVCDCFGSILMSKIENIERLSKATV